MSAIHRVRTPLHEKDIRVLKLEDIVYVSGTIFTFSTEAHKRMVREGVLPPLDTSKINVMYHSHPLVKKTNDKWEVVGGGPTTSRKYEIWESEVIPALKIRAIIGKGGMGNQTCEAMRKYGCVYLSSLGGEGAPVYSRTYRRIRDVVWEDLGRPDTVWVMDVEGFGPLIVTIDAQGQNLFDRINPKIRESVTNVYKKIGRTPPPPGKFDASGKVAL